MKKVINFDDVGGGIIKKHSQNCNQNPNRIYRILIIGDSGLRKTDVMHER